MLWQGGKGCGKGRKEDGRVWQAAKCSFKLFYIGKQGQEYKSGF